MNNISTNSVLTTQTTQPNNRTFKISFNLEDDYDDDILEIMTSSKSNSSRSFSYQEYINDDDFYYGKQNPTSNEFFPIAIIVLTIFSMLAIIVYLVYTSWCCCCGKQNGRKRQRHPSLSILNHYLFLNIFLTFILCLKIMTSPLVRNSTFYSRKTNGICTIHQFVYLFVESTQSLQLLLVWLMMLAERGVLKSCWVLYADYELNRAMRSVTSDLEVRRRLCFFVLCLGG